jgi:hypothetical protein
VRPDGAEQTGNGGVLPAEPFRGATAELRPVPIAVGGGLRVIKLTVNAAAWAPAVVEQLDGVVVAAAREVAAGALDLMRLLRRTAVACAIPAQRRAGLAAAPGRVDELPSSWAGATLTSLRQPMAGISRAG